MVSTPQTGQNPHEGDRHDPADRSDHRLVWKRTTVEGRLALYGEAGEGLPVVFLHGWGLGQHAYRRPLKRLVQLGCHVWAPALPGFGGTADLPGDDFSLAGYATWLDEFLRVVVLWGGSDRITRRSSDHARCRASGSEGEFGNGNHSWLLPDPDSFGEVMTNVVGVGQLARSLEHGKAKRRRRFFGLARGGQPR